MELQFVFLTLLALVLSVGAFQSRQCEVCIKVLNRFRVTLRPRVLENNQKIEVEFKKFCQKTENEERHFCDLMGALENPQKHMMDTMARAVMWAFSTLKICHKLRAEDPYICDIVYNLPIDLKTANVEKLPLPTLRKIWQDHGGQCDKCSKADFIEKVKYLQERHLEL